MPLVKFPIKKLIKSITFGLMLLLGALAVGLYADLIAPFGPGSSLPIRGIDVSHHQGQIDWKAVRNDGIIFAYIKATEGGDFVDGRFQENWGGTTAAGLIKGAYHVFTYCRDGETQASNYMKIVPVENGALPMAVDISSGDNCGQPFDDQQLIKEFQIFCDRITQTYSKEPIIYCSRNSRLSMLIPVTKTKWVRGLIFHPRLYYGNEWTFWQFTKLGTVEGIDGSVDVNVFNGMENEWVKFLSSMNIKRG